jgi:hypothetical protein
MLLIREAVGGGSYEGKESYNASSECHFSFYASWCSASIYFFLRQQRAYQFNVSLDLMTPLSQDNRDIALLVNLAV